MGNREQLLLGARRCLVERGWARSTVRDVAEAAGVNHAAIGYHFGSRERLLVEALVQAVDELDEELRRRAAGATEAERWDALVESFRTHRVLWLSQLEAVAQAEHVPELRERLAVGQRRAREGMGGAVPLAVLTGLMLQAVVEPGEPVGGADVAAAVPGLLPD